MSEIWVKATSINYDIFLIGITIQHGIENMNWTCIQLSVACLIVSSELGCDGVQRSGGHYHHHLYCWSRTRPAVTSSHEKLRTQTVHPATARIQRLWRFSRSLLLFKVLVQPPPPPSSNESEFTAVYCKIEWTIETEPTSRRLTVK